MTSKMSKLTCTKCHHEITSRQYLTCAECQQTYDLPCANVLDKRSYRLMTSEHKMNWRCTACITQHNSPNVTLRKPSILTETIETDDSSTEELTNENQSIYGDTIHSPACDPKMRTDSTQILEQISQLLDQKLENNKKEILSQIKIDIRSLIQDEIKQTMLTIKNETTDRINNMASDQKKLECTIESLTKKIQDLEIQCNRLKINFENRQENLKHTNKSTFIDNSKKIVLYGLDEPRQENENELYSRVVTIFGEMMNVNLEGYIEELTRLGRRGYRRPIVIELISKRMANYILRNRHAFSRSGLAATEYLDNESLQKKKELGDALKLARKQGNHAIIRGNKLIINGKVYNPKNDIEISMNKSKTSDYPTIQPNLQKSPQRASRHIGVDINNDSGKKLNSSFRK